MHFLFFVWHIYISDLATLFGSLFVFCFVSDHRIRLIDNFVSWKNAILTLHYKNTLNLFHSNRELIDNHCYFLNTQYILFLFLLSVGYNSKEVSYVWKSSKGSVDYETELKLSQFDIMQTEWRALNFSRGTLSKYSYSFHKQLDRKLFSESFWTIS